MNFLKGTKRFKVHETDNGTDILAKSFSKGVLPLTKIFWEQPYNRCHPRKTPGQTGTAAAERTEGQAGESPAGEPALRPSEPVPAPEPAEEPAAEPDGNGARPGDAASEGGRP